MMFLSILYAACETDTAGDESTPQAVPATSTPESVSLATPIPKATALHTATHTPVSTPTATSKPTATLRLVPTAVAPPTATPTITPVPIPSATPRVTPVPLLSTPAVIIGEVVFEAEIAQTQRERGIGLSGRESLEPMTGMLFLFQTGRTTDFWMRGMLIPLDFVWIGEDCTVVDTTVNVPQPDSDAPNTPLPSYSSSVPAAYTFEINAGEIERFGIQVGDKVSFSRITADEAKC